MQNSDTLALAKNKKAQRQQKQKERDAAYVEGGEVWRKERTGCCRLNKCTTQRHTHTHTHRTKRKTGEELINRPKRGTPKVNNKQKKRGKGVVRACPPT